MVVWPSENGHTLCPVLYLSFQFQMNKKETEEHANSTAFKELFCLRFNLSKTSNDDTISALRPGLKKGKDFRGLV